MRPLKIIGRVFLFIILTILTQIGGVVYLINFSTYGVIDKKIQKGLYARIAKVFSFFILYFLATFAIVPFAAKAFGRVPLPLTTTNHLRPVNILTCLLNRHYVKTDLREVTFAVATSMNQKHPGTVTNYLDANFPFIDQFPLIPHLSHNDGKKLDVSFCYLDVKTGAATNEVPSIIGYGICEEPLGSEINTATECEKRGSWQYSLMKKVMPQGSKKEFVFSQAKTRDLVNFFAERNEIGKIFIEPHLKARLQLKAEKVRFHGCQAVRHDDHIHVQLK